MNDVDIPKAISRKALLILAAVAVLLLMVSLASLLIGAFLSSEVLAGARYVGGILGFGHEHTDELVAVEDDQGNVQYYTCGMHPWVILPKPGDCPICHMELTPIDPAKFTGEITIDPVVVQNIGVRVEPVTVGPLVKTIRTVGTVDYNEKAVRDVNIKVSGWIEKLYVDFVGAEVKAGDPLFELYSPQLYAAQEEYLLAWRNRDATPDGPALLDAARTRLEYFDITDEQIEALEQAGKPFKTLTIRSPHTGVVIAKHANEGMKVDPGMQAYRIADLSMVWVLVTLYEYQLPYIQEDIPATMELDYLPGHQFDGRVIYIYPFLDPKTREAQVRLSFDNPGYLLKPGMFASVQLHNTLATEKVLVPRSAVIDTGQRQVAFVSLGDGKFEPRELELGVESTDDRVEVISGLKPGEMVVTSGQFLIDSEARFREALIKMVKGNLAAEQSAAAPIEGRSEISVLPDEVADTLGLIIRDYLAVGDVLARDKTDGIHENAIKIAETVDVLVKLEVPEDPHLWHRHQEAVASIRSAALKLAESGDLEQARLRFSEISTSLKSLLAATGVPPKLDMELHVLRCPMYRKGQGGSIWMQPAGDVRNPYLGAMMLECFDERMALPVTGADESDSSDQTEGASSSDLPAEHQHESVPDVSISGPVSSGDYPLDFCLISGEKLGSMGEPVKVQYEGRTLKFCCRMCIGSFREDPAGYLKKLNEAARTLGHSHGEHGR